MAGHEPELFTGVLVVRAWGKNQFNQLFAEAAKDVVQGKIPLHAGVLYESDPGGGGPYNTVILRNFQFRMDGVDLPGYPGVE